MTTRTPPQEGDVIRFVNDAGEVYLGPVVDVLSVQFTFTNLATQKLHFLFHTDDWTLVSPDQMPHLPTV